MFAGLVKMSLRNCIATQLIRRFDVSYVKTTLSLRKYHVTCVIAMSVFYVIFMLEKLRKKVFPF